MANRLKGLRLAQKLSLLDLMITPGIVLIHVLAVCSLWFFTWSGLEIAGAMSVTMGLFGVTLCYHRLLTHGSFKTPNWFKYFLTVFGAMSLQGGPIQWVGVHRLHHRHSDEEHDPHSPKHGFTWAHMLWCLLKQPEGATVHENPRRAAGDLQKDPVIAFIDRFFWVPQAVAAVTLFSLGFRFGGWHLGLSWLLMGCGLATTFVYHITWFVNSAAHTCGYQTFKDTGDNSRNCWQVALISFGEGWHNNHHAHQRSAKHGMRWWEIDLTYWIICLLSVVGLAKDIKLPKEA